MERFDGQLDTILRRAGEASTTSTVHRHGGVTRPPKPVDARAQKLFDLVRDCGAALGQQIGWQATGGVCDGNNIAACGVPVVDTMGVRGGADSFARRIHDRPQPRRARGPVARSVLAPARHRETRL